MKLADYKIKKQRKKKPQLTIQTLNLIKKTSTMKQTKSGSIRFDDYDWKVGADGIRAIGKKKKQKKKYEEFDYSQLNIIQELGRGGQSEVKLCKYSGKGLHALKIFFLDGRSHEYKNERNEIDLLQSIDHEYIVRMEQAFTKDQRICLLLEYMNCGSLHEILRRQSHGIRNEAVLSLLTSQILESLEYLHGEKLVVHCDIKPSNFLVSTKGFVKLTDFGLANRMQDNIDPSLGTKQYKSPQCHEFRKCTEKCDIWSLGMTIAELWKGEFPLPINEGGACEMGGPNAGGAVQKTPFHRCINDGGNDFLSREDYSPELFEFLRSCLLRDDRERPNASQLLKFPFITKYFISRFDRKRDIGNWARQFQIRISYDENKENSVVVNRLMSVKNERNAMMNDVVHLAVNSGPSPYVTKKKKKNKNKKKKKKKKTPSIIVRSGVGISNNHSPKSRDRDEDEDDENEDSLQFVRMINIVKKIKTV